MTPDAYIHAALEAKAAAQAPFSHFKVGAVLVTSDQRMYRGCNIELSSFGLTICAERVAIFKAISEGEQAFRAIYIASDAEKFTSPCGACRQVLWELAGDIEVYMINRRGQYQKSLLHELLPFGFDRSFFKT